VVGKPEGKKPLGRPRWEDINMYIGEIRWEDMNWIHVAQNRNHWCVLVNKVMHVGVP
jgi:hypothetical protein